MATILLTQEEYTHLTTLEKDLIERSKKASPRAATKLRELAKGINKFLAEEAGKRATSTMKADARKEQEALKLQRQQERLAKMQERMSKAKTTASADPSRPGRTEKTEKTA